MPKSIEILKSIKQTHFAPSILLRIDHLLCKHHMFAILLQAQIAQKLAQRSISAGGEIP